MQCTSGGDQTMEELLEALGGYMIGDIFFSLHHILGNMQHWQVTDKQNFLTIGWKYFCLF